MKTIQGELNDAPPDPPAPPGPPAKPDPLEILGQTRASDAERRRTKLRIRQACREGRIDRPIAAERVKLAATAVTRDDLTRLVRDLDGWNRHEYARYFGAGCGALIMLCAWEPVWLSGWPWILLAAPVTVVTFCVMIAALHD